MLDDTFLLYVLGAYLIGAIPSGLIVGKLFYKVDLRHVGSCNIGATNAYRILGKKAAIIVFLMDFFKGLGPVYLASPDSYLMTVCGIFGLIGHMWPIYIGFKGGRGVATGLGVFAALSPIAAFTAICVWVLVVMWKRIVSLASIVAAPVLPLVSFMLHEPKIYTYLGSIGAMLVIFRHKDNIKRLYRGEEAQIQKVKR